MVMATANFYARLERIQKAQERMPEQKPVSFRAPGMAGIQASNRMKARRRHPIRDHLVSTSFGLVLGCLVAVALIGLSLETAPWGPGTAWHDILYYPVLGGLALAPVLMLVSLFLAAKRPSFALFSLGYLSGIVVPLFI
jgi:hypothetical protein